MRRPQPVPSIEEIVEHLKDWGISHVGVCSAEIFADTRTALHERKAAGLHADMGFTYRNPDRSTDPTEAVDGAWSIIVAARPYLTATEPPIPDSDDGPHGRVGKYAWVDHYAPLREGLRSASRMIRRSGHRAVAFADDNSIVDRATAYRAGLGWYGKNANLLIPGAGSFFVLGSIITTAGYEWNERVAPDGCGSCTRCFEGIYGCDDCQDVCPVSVRLGQRNTVALSPEAQPWVDALELLDRPDDWIEERYGQWYIANRDFDLVRRNALVVVGNVGDPTDMRVRATVERYRQHSNAALAEHADWAAQQLLGRL